jgi:UDP-2,4-diacetamido-2,4,6-trideoxy-beta-L-altropyranose hydrolase
MQVAFRADASVALGAGHVMRCLALADKLKCEGAATRFVCREQAGDLCGLIESRGHLVKRFNAAEMDWRDDVEVSASLLADAAPWDWLVADHYALDARWERHLHRYAGRLLAIDDLADRPHDCDLLLDQNLKEQDAYAGLLPAHCNALIGPRYALLRPEFRHLHLALRPHRTEVERILILFGGSDPLDLTGLALDALDSLRDAAVFVDVVVGAGSPQRAALQDRCARRPQTRLHIQADNVAQLMAAADLAIGATGITTWERACLGLPALAITFAENQRPIAEAAQAAGMLTWLGDAEGISTERLAEAIARILASPRLRQDQSAACMRHVDGAGCDRVVEAMRS